MLVPFPPRSKPGSQQEPATPGFSFPVVRLRVVLLELVSAVWRRFQVPSNFTLRRLHVVLQHVMGWKESPHHEFRVGANHFGMPSENSGPLRDSRWITLQDLLVQKATTFVYEYDVGTRWTHQVRIEGLLDGDSNNQRPVCLDGAGACPPEECGDADTYVDLLEARPNPSGNAPCRTVDLDPDAFDLEAINTGLATLRF